MALASAGLGLAVGASAAASALTVPTSTTITMTTGTVANVKVGHGKVFDVQTCSSGTPTTVACQVLPTAQKVEVWCLAATGPAVPLAVTYIPLGSASSIATTTINVNCKAAKVPTIRVLHAKYVTPLKGTTTLANNSCSTNTLGAQCTTLGDVVVETCELGVTANTLPALVTATVTVDGATAVNGQQVHVYFVCTA